jgi:hypothetical protein
LPAIEPGAPGGIGGAWGIIPGIGPIIGAPPPFIPGIPGIGIPPGIPGIIPPPIVGILGIIIPPGIPGIVIPPDIPGIIIEAPADALLPPPPPIMSPSGVP